MARGALAVVGELAADQWGLLTAAQARANDVSPTEINRMVDQGALHRVAHGVYATPTALADPLLELRAAWLNLAPATPAYERLDDPSTGVVSHASAAHLHELGDLTADIHHFTLPRRYQTRRDDVHTYRAELTTDDVTIVEGLPTTTIPRTISDLTAVGHDTSHVAQIVRDALWEERTSIDDLRRAMEARHGDKAGAILDDLLRVANLSPKQLLASVLKTPAVNDAINTEVWDRAIKVLRVALGDNIGQAAVRDALAPLRDASKVTRQFTIETALPQEVLDRMRATINNMVMRPDVTDTIRALRFSPALDLINSEKYARMLRQYSGPNLHRLAVTSRAAGDDEDDAVNDDEEHDR